MDQGVFGSAVLFQFQAGLILKRLEAAVFFLAHARDLLFPFNAGEEDEKIKGQSSQNENDGKAKQKTDDHG